MVQFQTVMFQPKSTWTAPASFPDLSRAKVIGIDLETKDPGLKELGPGTIRGDGHVAGIAVAATFGDNTHPFIGYYPIGHDGGGNLDKRMVLRWLKKELGRKKQEKVGANLPYDLEWLRTEKVEVKGKLRCVQVAEALLDEEKRNYKLEALSRQYLGAGKEETLLREAAEVFGIDPKADLWMLHAKYVGAYAEVDAINPILIWEKQKDLLALQDLTDVYDLECALMPLHLDMRFQGIPVDLEKAEALNIEWLKIEDTLRLKLKKFAGFDLNEWSNDHLFGVACKHRYPHQTTAKGNPSFQKKFLKHHRDIPFYDDVLKLREIDRLRRTYLVQNIIKGHINGRIHPSINPVGSDDKGTRTGRYSYSGPNLQQVSSRSELSPALRAVYIPPEGRLWAKKDYSQQEPRILVHYAYLMGFRGAKEFRERYLKDKSADFYAFIQEDAEVVRDTAKILTLARFYGMGVKACAADLGVPEAQGRVLLSKFDESVPFVKMLSESCMAHANKRGWIKTVLGRRRHFNLWEPFDGHDREEKGEDITALSYEKAEQEWPGVKLVRFGVYKALNALIQGSAGDMVKKAMLGEMEEGYVPLLTVHDEINNAVKDKEEAIKQAEMMEHCMELTVPMKVDLDIGGSWK